LELISAEIKSIGGKLHSEDDLNVALPYLSQFVSDMSQRLSSSPRTALLRIGKTVNEMLSEKGAIWYKLRQFLECLEKSKREEICDESLTETIDPEEDGDLDLNEVNEALRGIVELNSVVISAHEVAKDFVRMQELMLRSVTLNAEESDRLLRYQTTWERRLSSAIGELLALRGRNEK
jgi:hypothetical protein